MKILHGTTHEESVKPSCRSTHGRSGAKENKEIELS
jgi:hypothetical protein